MAQSAAESASSKTEAGTAKVRTANEQKAELQQQIKELQAKLAELLERGIQYIWVVRLTGPLRVEVYSPGQKMQIVPADGELRAPGVLQNPVPVRALVDREVALEATLRNLLNRKGYASLEALQAEEAAKGRAEGEARGKADSILAILRARGLSVPEPVAAQILQCRNLASLDAWLLRAMTVSSAAEVLC